MSVVGYSRVEELPNQTIPDTLLKSLNAKLEKYRVFKVDREVITQQTKLCFVSTKSQPSVFIEKNQANKTVKYVPLLAQGKAEDLKFFEGSDRYKGRKLNPNAIGKIIQSSKKDLDFISLLNQCFQQIESRHLDIEVKKIQDGKYEYTGIFSKQPLATQVVECDKKKNGKRIFCQNMLESFFPQVYQHIDSNLNKMAENAEKNENKQKKSDRRQAEYEEDNKNLQDFLERSKKGDFGNKEGKFTHFPQIFNFIQSKKFRKSSQLMEHVSLMFFQLQEKLRSQKLMFQLKTVLQNLSIR